MPKRKSVISLLELRRSMPQVCKELDHGTTFVILSRGKPVGELKPPSKDVLKAFFGTKKRSPKELIKQKLRKKK